MGPLEQFISQWFGGGGTAPNDTTMASMVNKPGGMLNAAQSGGAAPTQSGGVGLSNLYSNPLVATGAAMMQSTGNFGQALGAGLQAGAKQLGENAKAAEALGKGAQGQGAGAVNFAAAAQQQQENAAGPQYGQQLAEFETKLGNATSTIQQLVEQNKQLTEELKRRSTASGTSTPPTVPTSMRR